MTLPKGIRNNNPLNIRRGSKWKGGLYPQTDPDFEQFQSMQWGIRAGFIILRNYITGNNSSRQVYNTPRKIIRRWAPESENKTQAYIDFVCGRMGLMADQVIHFNDRRIMIALVEAMIFYENGRPVDAQVIASAYDLV